MRSDSPGPSWYEPPLVELDDDQEREPVVAELLVVAAGIVHWTAAIHDTDD